MQFFATLQPVLQNQLQYFSYGSSKAIPTQNCSDIITRLAANSLHLVTNGRQDVICVDLDTEKAKEPRSQLVNANDITDTVLDIKFCDLITIVLIVDYPQQYLTETKNCEISFRQQFAKRRTSSLFFFSSSCLRSEVDPMEW